MSNQAIFAKNHVEMYFEKVRREAGATVALAEHRIESADADHDLEAIAWSVTLLNDALAVESALRDREATRSESGEEVVS